MSQDWCRLSFEMLGSAGSLLAGHHPTENQNHAHWPSAASLQCQRRRLNTTGVNSTSLLAYSSVNYRGTFARSQAQSGASACQAVASSAFQWVPGRSRGPSWAAPMRKRSWHMAGAATGGVVAGMPVASGGSHPIWRTGPAGPGRGNLDQEALVAGTAQSAPLPAS